MIATKVEQPQFMKPYYIIGDWDFSHKQKAVHYLGADTETKLYYNGELLTEEQAYKFMCENGQTWCKQNIEVRAYAFMLSDGENFVCFQHIHDFMLACSILRAKTVVWYNSKFDFSIFDYYFLKNGWNTAEKIASSLSSYRKMPHQTYSSLHSDMGQRYKLSIWHEYSDSNYHTKVHRTDHVDLMNIMGGGLARNLESWNVTDKNGNPIRKLEMDYVNDSIEDCIDYIWVDTVGLKRLADIVDTTLKELTGFSFWEQDYITAGGLAKKTLLKYMYGNDKHSLNVKAFQQQFYMSEELDRFLRENHLYRGGLTILNDAFKGKAVNGVYKYDVNSMYPYEMFTMRLPNGKAKYVTEYYPSEDIKIFHLTRLIGKVKKNKIGVWQDTFTKEFTDFIEEYSPIFMYEEELNELKNWYDLEYEYDFIYYFEPCISEGFRDYISFFYEKKCTSKGTIKNGTKLLLNSAYGKLAQRTIRVIGDYELSENGYVHFVKKGEEVDKKSMLSVVIGAYVTALARVTLLTLIRDVCKEDVLHNFIYCDTDSIHALLPYEKCDSKKLGYLKNEGKDGEPFTHAMYLAPKTYMMYYEGEYEVHSKGVNTTRVLEKIKDLPFIEACKIFRPNVPFTCLCGLNAIGGKALINKDKFILNEKGFVTDLTALDGGIFCEV